MTKLLLGDTRSALVPIKLHSNLILYIYSKFLSLQDTLAANGNNLGYEIPQQYLSKCFYDDTHNLCLHFSLFYTTILILLHLL